MRYILQLLLLTSPLAAASTSITLVASGHSTVIGNTVTLTATVSPAVDGQVTLCDATAPFCENAALISTATLSSGVAVFRFVPGIGSHSYRAVFAGNSAYSSSASATQTVLVTGTYSSISELTASGSQGNYTLTATVTTAGTHSPSGNLSFLDTSPGGNSLGDASLVATGRTWISAASSPISSLPVPAIAASGDFNGDGKVDLAIADTYLNRVAVFLGNGDGTFQSPNAFAIGSSVSAVLTGDFNRDGKLDLAVANSASNTLSILLGNGDGTFQSQVTYALGTTPISMAIADFNEDGFADIVAANNNSTQDTISLLLGNGDGTFRAQTSYPLRFAFAVAAADVNGDGNQDLIATYHGNPGAVYVQLGNGDGTFQSAVSYAAGIYPSAVNAGDFNEDGILDLAVSNSGSNSLTILLGNGDGTFQPGSTYSTGTYPFHARLADLNGDGHIDAVTANYQGGNLSVLLGNGDGTFGAAQTYAVASPVDVAPADLDGDGVPDLVVCGYTSGKVSVLLNRVASSATLTRVAPHGIGNHLVEASYPGEASIHASTSATVSLAGSALTTLTLGVNSSSSHFGQTTVLTAYLNPFNGSGVSSDGEVIHFYAGQTLLASATLNSGIASWSGALAAGVSSVSAIYAGDGNFLASTSPAATVTVQRATPAISWSNPNSILFGTALSGVQLNASAGIAGTFSYSPAVGAILLAGTHTLSVVFTPADAADYTSATASVAIQIHSPAGALEFVPVIPCRLVDTRNGNGDFGGPEMEGQTIREFNLANGGCSLPSNAEAYALNVTVVPRSGLSYLTIWPGGQARPLVSTLNSDGRVKANAAMVAAGANGLIDVYVSNTTHLILDVTGYFVPAGTSAAGLQFFPLAPCRVADTKGGTGPLGGPALQGGAEGRSFPLPAGPCSIPATAQAFSLNIEASPRNGLGFLTAWPSGAVKPGASVLNVSEESTGANTASLVSADANGAISLYASDDTDLSLDMNGYFAPRSTGGLYFYTVTPCRVFDSRDSGLSDFGGIHTISVNGASCGVPSSAEAFVLNVTGVSDQSASITVWPAGQMQPDVDLFKMLSEPVASNMSIVGSGGGAIQSNVSGPAHLIFDISGYFAP